MELRRSFPSSSPRSCLCTSQSHSAPHSAPYPRTTSGSDTTCRWATTTASLPSPSSPSRSSPPTSSARQSGRGERVPAGVNDYVALRFVRFVGFVGFIGFVRFVRVVRFVRFVPTELERWVFLQFDFACFCCYKARLGMPCGTSHLPTASLTSAVCLTGVGRRRIRPPSGGGRFGAASLSPSLSPSSRLRVRL